MNTPTHKYLPVFTVAALLIISTACYGFLLGHTARSHDADELVQFEQVRDGLVTSFNLLKRGAEAVKLVMLR